MRSLAFLISEIQLSSVLRKIRQTKTPAAIPLVASCQRIHFGLVRHG